VVAALASNAQGGATVMATFALASGAGLWLTLSLGPRLWARVAGASGAPGPLVQTAAVRLAGVTLAAASGWALWHGLSEQIAALCA